MGLGFKIKKHVDTGINISEIFATCDHCNGPIANHKDANVEFEGGKLSGKAYIVHKKCSNEFAKTNEKLIGWATLKDFNITANCME